MPKLDLARLKVIRTTGYLPPYDREVAGRSRIAVGEEGGLKDFGANVVTLEPGAWSSQRHWHTHEDELVVVLSGEITLVTDAGAEVMHAGDCATFPKGVADGHHLQNRSSAIATFLAVGTDRAEDECSYPDIDQFFSPKTGFVRKSEKR